MSFGYPWIMPAPFLQKNRWEILWLALPLTLSIFYFWNLGQNSFWYDELQTWFSVSQNNFADFWREYRIRETSPPLYYSLNYFLHRFFSIDEFSLRFLSAAALAVCNTMLFFYLRRYFNIWVAIAVAILMVTNGWMLSFAQLARSYGLLTLLSTFSLILCWHLLQKGYEKSIFRTLVVSLILCLFAHYFGSLVVGAIAALFLLFAKERKFYLQRLLAVLILPFLGFVYILWNQHWSIHLTFVKNLEWQGIQEVFGLVFDSGFTSILLNFSLVFLFFRVATKRTHTWDRFLGFLFSFNLIVLFETILVSIFKPAYSLRYLTFLTPTHLLFLCVASYLAFSDLFSFAKNFGLQKNSVRICFLLSIFLFALSQKLQQIEDPDRFSQTANYPLRQALEATALAHEKSRFSKEPLELFIEENSPDAVRLYFPKYQMVNVGIANPKDSVEEKTRSFHEWSTKAEGSSLYYLKVITPEVNEDFNVIHLKNWKSEKVFLRDRLSVYRFSKIN